MDTQLDATIKERIKSSLDEFLNSLRGDSPTLSAFVGRWSSVCTEVQSNHDNLDEETLELVNNAALVVGSVATSLMELQVESEKIYQETDEDISRILSAMNGVTVSEDKVSEDTFLPKYIKLAYTWLLGNVDNPYPSLEVKKRIAREANTQQKDIDAWFVDVRRCIGWTSLRRSKFQNKRKEMIKVASQCLKPCGHYLPRENPMDNLHLEFIAIEERVKSLYNHQISETSPQSEALIKRQSRSPKRRTLKRSYPSSETSSDRSRDSLSPSPKHAKIQRYSSVSSAEDGTEEQQLKHLMLCPRPCSASVDYLPSPALSLHDIYPTASHAPITNSLKRKRRPDNSCERSHKRVQVSSTPCQPETVDMASQFSTVLTDRLSVWDLSNVPVPPVMAVNIDTTTPFELNYYPSAHIDLPSNPVISSSLLPGHSIPDLATSGPSDIPIWKNGDWMGELQPPAIDIDFIFNADALRYGLDCGDYTQYQTDYQSSEKSPFILDSDSVESLLPPFDWTHLLQPSLSNAIGTYREPLTVLNRFSPAPSFDKTSRFDPVQMFRDEFRHLQAEITV